ncbi:hypothetical protein D3C72_2145840 [compost metagenome]
MAFLPCVAALLVWLSTPCSSVTPPVTETPGTTRPEAFNSTPRLRCLASTANRPLVCWPLGLVISNRLSELIIRPHSNLAPISFCLAL